MISTAYCICSVSRNERLPTEQRVPGNDPEALLPIVQPPPVIQPCNCWQKKKSGVGFRALTPNPGSRTRTVCRPLAVTRRTRNCDTRYSLQFGTFIGVTDCLCDSSIISLNRLVPPHGRGPRAGLAFPSPDALQRCTLCPIYGISMLWTGELPKSTFTPQLGHVNPLGRSLHQGCCDCRRTPVSPYDRNMRGICGVRGPDDRVLEPRR